MASPFDSFVTAQHAAAIAIAGMALRELLRSARDEEPGVVSLRLAVAVDPASHSGSASIDVEIIDRSGAAVGGYSL